MLLHAGGDRFRSLFHYMNYKSKRWERLREKVLRRDNYMCQVSLRYGRRVPANTVHHICPAAKYPERAWDERNLIAVDPSVHNRLHERDSDELSAEGQALMERTARRYGWEL